MARVKVTAQNINSKLLLWKNGTSLTDELIFLPADSISEDEVIRAGWKESVIIEVQSDIGGFKKFVYKEKLV